MSKLKEILLYIAFALIVLPILFFSEIISAKALTSPDLTTLPYSTNSSGYVVIGDKSNDTFFAVTNQGFDAFTSILNNNNISGNRFLDLKTNFYGLSEIRSWWTANTNNYRIGDYYSYNNNSGTWTKVCDRYGSPTSCPYYYTLNSNNYIYAFLRTGSSTPIYVTGKNVNSPIFWYNYNLEYYDTPVNYFGSYTNYFGQPSNVKGSELDFSGEELSASILGFDYSYINTYMYEFSNVDNETTLISHQFNYNSPDLTGNYKLGMVVTTKMWDQGGIIVHAITNTGTWACNSITPLKSYNDINYQFYVECPSVNFNDTDDDYLKIVVNGANEYVEVVGPLPQFFTNYLVTANNNNKYVGISSILRVTTDTPPVPVEPDTPSEPDINESINNMNNNIMDPSGPDTSSLSNSAGWLPAGPVDSIINLPITMLQSLNNVLSGSSCSPISIPIPFINYNYSLPCLSTIISNMGFSTWWEWVGTIASAFILYKYLINLYAWVDKTLTFRENNWNDWGGI